MTIGRTYNNVNVELLFGEHLLLLLFLPKKKKMAVPTAAV
jgi:hypothetical protein